MEDFVIEIADKQRFRKDVLLFSERDLLESKNEAGDSPVTPLIVKTIEQKAKEKGYRVVSEKSELFRMAKEILVKRVGSASIAGQIIEGKLSYVAMPSEAMKLPLYLIQYNNPLEEIEQLTASIRKAGNIPIVWSKARGLMIDHLSKLYPLFENVNMADLNDPAEVIKFIIRRPRERLVYIFEDFHHFIGDKDVVNPGVGEIRALLKDLYRNLKGRGESVYLFVPSTYEPPPELQPFFDLSLKRPKQVKGYLDKFGRLLTDPANIARTKPVIGVDHIINRLIQVLAQMEANNPLLVGQPGVGKTSVVDGLAKALYNGRVAPSLKGKMLYSLSLNSLIAGTRYRGDFEERFEGLMEEVLQNKDRIIVFIDEIHTLMDAGSSEGAVGAGDILKPLLAKGQFPCIGATTLEGAKYLSKDPALARRFKKIMVKAPSIDEAVKILKGISGSFEKHHRLKIEDDALVAAVELSEIHIADEYLPGKAVSLVDGASAYCGMQGKKSVTKEDIIAEIERLKNT